MFTDRLAIWRSAYPDRADRFPDAVTDTERRRQIAARARLPTLRRIRQEAIRHGSAGRLVMLTADLPGVGPGDLYTASGSAAARALVGGLVGDWPAWYRLELGKRGVLHVHILTAREAENALPDGIHVRNIYSLSGLLAYLAKPRDGLAARSAFDRAPVGVAVAAEKYLTARADRWAQGKRRLPAGSGVVNLPRRALAAALAPGLVLAVFVADLAARLAACFRLAGLLAARAARKASARRPALTAAPRLAVPFLGFLAPCAGRGRPPDRIRQRRAGLLLPVRAADLHFITPDKVSSRNLPPNMPRPMSARKEAPTLDNPPA